MTLLRERRIGLIVAGLLASSLTVRAAVPARPLDAVGPNALFDAALTLALAFFLALLALALGDSLLSLFRLDSIGTLERACFSLGLGLGTLGFIVLGLGLVGALTPAALAAALVLLALLMPQRVGGWIIQGSHALRRLPVTWQGLPLLWRLLAGLGIWIAAAGVLLALAPPTAYDALMYHLVGPRAFLAQQAIFPSTSRWWINMPFVVESGYLIPIAFKSDSAARLLHLLWALTFFGTTYTIGRRWAGPASGRWATVILLGMPSLAIIASDADTDFGWATLELLSLSAILIWTESGKRGWIALAGVLAGIALGSKYLALVGIAALTVTLVGLSVRRGLKAGATTVGVFLLAAGLVALPWYLKNWLWLGDPLFPYLLGGWRLDPPRMWAASQLAQGFSPPSNVAAWLSLPIRMFLEPWDFGSSFPPSLLLLGSLLYPFVPRSRPLNVVALLALAECLLWSLFPALVSRYLIPTLPLLAILAAYSAGRFAFPPLIRRYGRILVVVLAVASVASTALFLTGIALQDGAPAVVAGQRSRADYLRAAVPTYAALAFALTDLPKGSSLLTTGDGRSYYCEDLCFESDDQTLWLNLLLEADRPADFEASLRRLGITHLLVSPQDIRFFEDHMPAPVVNRATSFLLEDVLPACGNLLFSDSNASLYEIDC